MKPLVYRQTADSAGRSLPWLNGLRHAGGAYIIRHRASGAVLYVGESHTRRLPPPARKIT